MGRFIYIFSIVALSSVLGGCEGAKPEIINPTGELSFSASSLSITANGSDKTDFTVLKGTTNVTGTSEIYLIDADGKQTKLATPSFTTTKDGTYTFKATYATETSAAVTITASGQPKAKYYRNVAVFKLTGTWCSFCPEGGRQLNDLANRVYPDRLIQVAFHGGMSDEPMLIPETAIITQMFKNPGYPNVITDLRASSGAGKLVGDTRAAIETSLSDYPASCGIRLESKVSGSTLNITAGVKASAGGSYRVAVYILESGLVYKQLDGSIYIDTFKHQHVARKLLSSSIMGDTLGTIAIDEEKTKEYSIEINKGWTLDNLNVVAYVINDTGYINNIVECKANNDSIDYRLNE